jgi:phage terminase large subunit-like protein
MGLRGAGARPIKPASAEHRPSAESHPWASSRLSRASRVIKFVESLPCSAGPLAGRKFRLCSWQKKFIRAVYKTDKEGRRLVRTAVLSVGRGNGKTTLAAALALCHLCGPEAESRGQVVSAANDRAQAGLIHREMAAMIERTPWIAKRVSIKRFTKELEDYGSTGSTYAALTRESGTKHGLSPSCVIYDELGQSEARDLLDALDTAMGKRAEPLMIVISTQAARDEAPMSQLIDYGLRIKRGEIVDPSFHLTLFSAPPDADPWVPKTWRLANPAIGRFRSLEDVKRLSLQAQRMPAAEMSFRNLVLNQRCDASAQFISAAAWKACGGQNGQTVQIDHLKGRPCFGGLDLGYARDLTALVLVFKKADGSFDVMPHCWLPGETLQERQDQDRMPYRAWADAGHLLTFPGCVTDPAAVARTIAELHGKYRIQALAFDRWRILDLTRELAAIGCDVPLIAWGQGFKDMSPAVDEVERLVIDRRIRHDGNPLLTMAVANARIEMDAAGNRKLSKRRSTGRIDPLIAAVMAIGVATRHVDEPVWQPFLEFV